MAAAEQLSGAEGQITAFDGVIEISQRVCLKPKLVAV